MSGNTVLLFPGQGAYWPNVLTRVEPRVRPDFESVLRTVDEVGVRETGDSLWELVTRAEAPTLEELLIQNGDLLQLAIYGVSVACAAVLRREGVVPRFLLGHSLGEIAALTVAGSFDIASGARLVCARNRALSEPPRVAGHMVALGTGAKKAEQVLSLIDGAALSIAVVNEPEQTVISGASDALERIDAVARGLGISCIRLGSGHPFHSQLMAPKVAPLRERLQQIAWQPPKERVYSPILGRFYRDTDDLPALLASHLVLPVHFADGLSALSQHGAETFIECGARAALTRIGQKVLAERGASFISLLASKPDLQSFGKAVAACVGTEQVSASATTAASEVEVILERLWLDNRARLVELVSAELSRGRLEERAQSTAAAVPSAEDRAQSSDSALCDEGEHSDSGVIVTRASVLARLTALYSEALEYPPEVFQAGVELEAELGVDSVKQTELFARVAAEYSLPERDSGFQLGSYRTLGQICDLIVAHAQTSAAPVPVLPSSAKLDSLSVNGTAPNRDAILADLRALYAEALEYPVEVFDENVELESELGVDSVKQTELFTRVADRYGVAERPENFQLASYATLGKVADFLCRYALYAAFNGSGPASHSSTAREARG